MDADLVARYVRAGVHAGCSEEQMGRLVVASLVLQPRQLAASAAAAACDKEDGPTEVGYGGARGGGKSYWLLAQMGADDCQRHPGLKCLLLRKVGKANIEHFEDLRKVVFRTLSHEFAPSRGVLTFSNGSKIVAGHFQTESDIDSYLGLEYDVIGVEEATTLTRRKYEHIRTCCRSSRRYLSRRWRPRLYSTTNAGGVGHAWYRDRFVVPCQQGKETETRFIPAKVTDNGFCNPEYRTVLERLSGWERRAWLDGDWDIAAGQYFRTFRRNAHVLEDFDDSRAVEWFAALDYGFAHYTVVLLGCKDGDGNVFVVDENAERMVLPEVHARSVKAMLGRHRVPVESLGLRVESEKTRPLQLSDLKRFVAGTDVFSRQSDGTSVAKQYGKFGIHLRPANTERVSGWAEILHRLGDMDRGMAPRLFIHARCGRLLSTLPDLQHDPNRPEDVLKVDCDEQGAGGDDAADALRYLVASRPKRAGFAAG